MPNKNINVISVLENRIQSVNNKIVNYFYSRQNITITETENYSYKIINLHGNTKYNISVLAFTKYVGDESIIMSLKTAESSK